MISRLSMSTQTDYKGMVDWLTWMTWSLSGDGYLVICSCNRRKALQDWKSNNAFRATYGNLLKIFTEARHKEAADALCAVLRKRSESH